MINNKKNTYVFTGKEKCLGISTLFTLKPSDNKNDNYEINY